MKFRRRKIGCYSYRIADLPYITRSSWKELEVVPAEILQDLILVTLKFYPVDEEDKGQPVPHLLLHTDGDDGPRTYLMGASPKLGLSKLAS